jgi:RNA polymerase sigma factor (sigma-70 family)
MHTTLQRRTGPPEPFIDEYAMKRSDFRARELALRFKLDAADQDDYRQDMMVQLLTALKRFDPDKSSRKTYISRVLDRFVLHATRTRCTRMQRPACSPLAFDDVEPGYEPTANDSHQGELDEQGWRELRLDLQEARTHMPERFQRACRTLSVMHPAMAAKALGIRRQSIYRIISEIRQHVKAADSNKIKHQRDNRDSATDIEVPGTSEVNHGF